MSDHISGINNVTPTYPVKPVQPANKDRKSGQRNTDKRAPKSGTNDEDDENKPVIDEYA